MSILGPFSSRTTSAVTVTLASASASVVTFSPSTRSRAGSSTVEPACAARRSTTTTSPTATFSWRPPAFTIAYTTLLLISARRTACQHAQSKILVPTCARAHPATTGDDRWPWGFASAPLRRTSGGTRQAAHMISAYRRADVLGYGPHAAGSNLRPAARGRRDLNHVPVGRLQAVGARQGVDRRAVGAVGLSHGVRRLVGEAVRTERVRAEDVLREDVRRHRRELELLDLAVLLRDDVHAGELGQDVEPRGAGSTLLDGRHVRGLRHDERLVGNEGLVDRQRVVDGLRRRHMVLVLVLVGVRGRGGD